MIRLTAVLLLACLAGCATPAAISSDDSKPAVARVEAPAANFAGLWKTTYGPMRLIADGEAVRGSYVFGREASIEGAMQDGAFVFEYREPTAHGHGRFVLAADGKSFHGTWAADGDAREREWEGERLQPTPGRVWLVILEGNWETSLEESEYDFGSMLRRYFTMAEARHVQVRQRFFHGAADFTRFASEVAYLPDPVVLLISTHGTRKGIASDDGILDASTIAAALRNAGNVKLLHLSGCDMMRGTVPRDILAALPPGVRFPISGYETTVAWDASALADFVYLTLVLIRGVDPKTAVEQARATAPYLGDHAPEGCPFDALGLAIVE